MAKPIHILVIRLSALGDVAMAVPVLRVFTETYPGIKITFLSKKHTAPLFAEFTQVSFMEADVRGKHKGFTGMVRLANLLKKQKITHIADLHNVLRSKILTGLLRLSDIKIKTIDKGRKEKKALTRTTGKMFVPLKHTTERYAEVFQKLGFPMDLQQHRFPAKHSLNEKLQAFFHSGKKQIGIAPFAAHDGKMYPLALMENVIRQLTAERKYTILLFGGGKKESEILEKIADTYSDCSNVASKFSLEEELLLISHLDVMLAMDSSNAHLAAIYGVPTITLWGVTHPYTGFYPFQQPAENGLLADRTLFPEIPTSAYGNKYPKGYEKAIETITPEMILARIKKIL